MGTPQILKGGSEKPRKSRLKHGIAPLNPKGYRNEDIIDCDLLEVSKDGKKAYHVTTKDGEVLRLRRVSSVIDTLGKSDSLVRWAARMAVKYVDQAWDTERKWPDGRWRKYTPGEKEFILTNAANYHEQYKNETAELGKQAHDWIHRFLTKGEWPGPDEELDDRVANCLELFAQEWVKLGWEILESERYVYDVELEVGGTLDVLAFDPKTNTYIVIDLKTGNGVWSSHLYQVSAYVNCCVKMGSRGYPASRAFVLRIGREDAYPHLLEIPQEELADGYEVFKILCQIQRVVSRLDGRYANRNKKWRKEQEAKAKMEAELLDQLEQMAAGEVA